MRVAIAGEYTVSAEKVKQGETCHLATDDQVIGAQWDDLGKFCVLTILRRVQP